MGNLTKHNFTGGYQAQSSAKQDKVELVGKFFKKEQKQTVETKTTQFQQQVETQTSQKIESSSGEERRQEALARRKEFLKEQEDLHMKLSSTEFKTTNVKSRQQLEEEREAFIQRAIQMVQNEAKMYSDRAKEDEMKRVEMNRLEQERIKKEEEMRAQAMLRAEEER